MGTETRGRGTRGRGTRGRGTRGRGTHGLILLISSPAYDSCLETTEKCTLQIQRKYQVLFVYHVPESPCPCPRVPRPRVPRLYSHVPEFHVSESRVSESHVPNLSAKSEDFFGIWQVSILRVVSTPK